jgi:hypothetical protein
LLPITLPLADCEKIIQIAPIDHRSSIVFIFCMSVAVPALVCICLVSMNSLLKNSLFEAYHLAWLAALLYLHSDSVTVSEPIILFHHLAVLTTSFFMKPPVLQPILEFCLHSLFHIFSHAHVHTNAGALPDGLECEIDSSSGFQHSLCTTSPWVAAFWTLLAGKKCRCRVQVFDLLLVAIFSISISGVYVVLVLLFALCGFASWPMLLYPASGILATGLLVVPYVLLHQFGVFRTKKTPLCASGPISFIGVIMYLAPMLVCAGIAPTLFWACKSVGLPLHTFHVEPLLLNLTSIIPYIFVRACPQALRPSGWIVFLVCYFWSNLKFMAFVSAEFSGFYAHDSIRISFLLFVPLYAFLQSLLSRCVNWVLVLSVCISTLYIYCARTPAVMSHSFFLRNSSQNLAFKPFLEILATASSGTVQPYNHAADSKVATSYWQAQAALGTATMQSLTHKG